MQLVKTISLIPQSFFAKEDKRFMDTATQTDVDRFTQVYTDPNRSLYLLREDGEILGFVDAEFKGDVVAIGFAVSAKHRKKGIGTQVLKAFLDQRDVVGKQVQAHINEDNVASKALLKKLNFKESGKDVDGFLQFTMQC